MKNLIMAVFAALLMVSSIGVSANPRAKKALASCCKTENCCPANASCCKGDSKCCDGSANCVCHPQADGTCVCEHGTQVAGKQVAGKKIADAKAKKASATSSCCSKKHS